MSEQRATAVDPVLRTELNASLSDLDVLERLRQTIMRHRIQMGNRVAAVEAGRSQLNPDLSAYFETRFQSIEDEVERIIADTIQDHVMWPWLQKVKGVGAGLAGAIVAPIDIRRAETVSALWRYAGQGVNGENGERDRPVKGQKLVYNAGLKKTCYLLAASFLRAGSPYRREYDEAKEQYERTRPEWTKGHRDLAARRKMVKLFLSHLHSVWRIEEGLPVRQPYAIRVLGHDGIKPPWDYVPFGYRAEVYALFDYQPPRS